MRPRLLDLLCCPACGSGLQAEAFEEKTGRIINGLLSCVCGQWFPIINSIPRLLLHNLRAQLVERHPEFYKDHASRLPEEVSLHNRDVIGTKVKTQVSFGYEWTIFSDYAVNNFTEFIRPLEGGFLDKKLGLDVGCGAGRHVKHATSLRAEVIGMDLSHAVDSAGRLNQDNPLAHFVQGDVVDLPFRRGTFDFIYSLGVLHHLPDPERGFRSLIPALKKEAPIFIWVYQRTKRKEWLEYARRMTTRMPLPVIKELAWSATVIDYGIVVNLYRLLQRAALVARWTPLRIKEYAKYDFAASYADWFDRLSAPTSHFYSQAELRAWFERAGLKNIETALVEDSWVWGKGERP